MQLGVGQNRHRFGCRETKHWRWASLRRTHRLCRFLQSRLHQAGKIVFELDTLQPGAGLNLTHEAIGQIQCGKKKMLT